MSPSAPIYIPSKGRWRLRRTMRTLDQMGVPYRVIVEHQEHHEYAAVIDSDRLLVLDPAYKRRYETCDDLGNTKGYGPGPARNFAWDHAVASGAAWHWVIDDNIKGFYRLNRNTKIKVQDGAFFRAMEDFADRYENIGMAGPQYEHFALRNTVYPPFATNTRIYSCNLIRNDVPFRWRGRYNEDTILSLDMLKGGWCTVQFNAFLQNKAWTQEFAGGNTAEFYAAEGTRPKSEMLARVHPDVARVTEKFGRVHHHVDYRPFKRNRLQLKPGIDLDAMEPNEYGMVLTRVGD
jgi:hypothetical protein